MNTNSNRQAATARSINSEGTEISERSRNKFPSESIVNTITKILMALSVMPDLISQILIVNETIAHHVRHRSNPFSLYRNIILTHTARLITNATMLNAMKLANPGRVIKAII